ncbi:MAG: Flp pilus assembly complex ATPase component TadA [Deltaproteobacteria bacterium]|nr:Flp pilus assembly complex ATPase component TadA [Deltaproteobacteria bacterium]
MALEGARGGRPASVAAGAVAEFMSATALFRGCDRAVIDRVAPHVIALEFAATQVIARAGAPDPALGLLFSGRAAVRQVNAATGASTMVATVSVGETFGEVGALLGTAEPTEVVAEDDSVVLLLGKDVVAQLSTKIAPFAHAVARRLAARVVQAQISGMRGGIAAAAPAPAQPLPEAPPPPATDGIRFVRIAGHDINDKLLALVPARVMQQHRLLPLELRGRQLTVGMVDPFNAASQAELRRILASVDVVVVAIGLDDYNDAFVRLRIDAALGGAKARGADVIAPDSLIYDVADQERDAVKAVGVIGDEVTQLASKIIAAAVERGASDIHLEQDVTGVRVRFRAAGQLVDWDQFIAPSFAKSLVARFKVLSGLDITERRLPQDGRIGVRIGRREIDLRISTLPASRGEKVVMRLFEAASMMRPLDAIFHEPRALAAMRSVLGRPYGALIVAGPTGSGKSSTLYSTLGERRRIRPDSNIVTVEDPIEYRLSGITQVQVNHAVDLGFAKILRAMLRQDPDVILVGEVRDPDTATLALEAAMTGHLLFTSLHANNAIGVIQRLENLGCSRALIGQSLAVVAVQRLARKLCPRCASSEVPPPILLESLAARGLVERSAPVPLPRAVGCPECNQTGYVGRVAVLEIMQLTDVLRAQIMSGVALGELEKLATDSGALVPFRRYASYLMSRQMLTPTEALLVVA